VGTLLGSRENRDRVVSSCKTAGSGEADPGSAVHSAFHNRRKITVGDEWWAQANRTAPRTWLLEWHCPVPSRLMVTLTLVSLVSRFTVATRPAAVAIAGADAGGKGGSIGVRGQAGGHRERPPGGGRLPNVREPWPEILLPDTKLGTHLWCHWWEPPPAQRLLLPALASSSLCCLPLPPAAAAAARPLPPLLLPAAKASTACQRCWRCTHCYSGHSAGSALLPPCSREAEGAAAGSDGSPRLCMCRQCDARVWKGVVSCAG
jgi:hypothetical protein